MRWRKLLLGLVIFAAPQLSSLVPTDFQASYSTYAIPATILAFVVFQVYVLWPSGTAKQATNDLIPEFGEILAEYRNTLVRTINAHAKNGSVRIEDIRANIMLPLNKRFRFRRAAIKMFYYIGEYSDSEKDILWRVKGTGTGTSGAAWYKARPIAFDSSDKTYQSPLQDLNEEQEAVPEIIEIASILSVPVKSRADDRIIAVLNFDSQLSITSTLFECNEIQDQAIHQGRKVAHMLPQNGVT